MQFSMQSRTLLVTLVAWALVGIVTTTESAEKHTHTTKSNTTKSKKKLARREIKKWQNGKHNYTSYRSFNPSESTSIDAPAGASVIDTQLLKQAHVFRHNKNPMVGYLGIPVRFTTDKKHIKNGVHLGSVETDETKFKEVYIP